jgi:serine/threonine-protein kinase
MREPPNLTGLPQPGQLFAGKYRIERVIGVGGMGAVFEAHHMHLDQKVAIKMLLPQVANDGAVVQRFVREGRAAVKIPSEHVARVHDVGTLPDGTPFMVMELLHGADLEAILEERGPLPVVLAVDVVLQTCEALAHAHGMGIVHRDLKPPNLFVTGPRTAPVVKLLDFGISKLPKTDDLSMTKTSAVMGSPMYMAPEQMRSARKVDARADIWGLGVLLYTMLTGRPPFESDTMPELCAMIVQDPTPSLVERREGVPPALAGAVERCLEKDPARRFASVAELARALAPFGSDEGRTMLARIEAASSAPAEEERVAQIGEAKIVVTPPAALRTGSAWGATSLYVPRSRRLTWLFGSAGLLGAVVLVTLFVLRHRPAPLVHASAPPDTPVASVVPASTPAPTSASAAVGAEPSADALASSSIAAAVPSAAPSMRPRRPLPVARPAVAPTPPPATAKAPASAAPAATQETPPGWTPTRKD